MNLIKNMEAVFLAVVVAAGVTAFATAKVAPHAAPVASATSEKIATVVVSTKRLTAAQKAQLDS
ncbi:MAG: hypothetical protein ACJ8GW_03725 [Massilia sp.]